MCKQTIDYLAPPARVVISLLRYCFTRHFLLLLKLNTDLIITRGVESYHHHHSPLIIVHWDYFFAFATLQRLLSAYCKYVYLYSFRAVTSIDRSDAETWKLKDETIFGTWKDEIKTKLRPKVSSEQKKKKTPKILPKSSTKLTYYSIEYSIVWVRCDACV